MRLDAYVGLLKVANWRLALKETIDFQVALMGDIQKQNIVVVLLHVVWLGREILLFYLAKQQRFDENLLLRAFPTFPLN